jgi:hypothetical protein
VQYGATVFRADFKGESFQKKGCRNTAASRLRVRPATFELELRGVDTKDPKFEVQMTAIVQRRIGEMLQVLGVKGARTQQ